ncbi:hypothetical protein FIU88_17120 [Halomonas sp. THAF12]|nr:hypothetical protein FIU88_17120 [Halomonas sp. THAF12]
MKRRSPRTKPSKAAQDAYRRLLEDAKPKDEADSDASDGFSRLSNDEIPDLDEMPSIDLTLPAIDLDTPINLEGLSDEQEPTPADGSETPHRQSRA